MKQTGSKMETIKTMPMAMSPAAKASHCHTCGARFVPVGCPLCDSCLASEKSRRQTGGQFAKCSVVGNVVAVGFREGAFRTTFEDGDEAEFSLEDILSLPESLIPLAQ